MFTLFIHLMMGPLVVPIYTIHTIVNSECYYHEMQEINCLCEQ